MLIVYNSVAQSSFYLATGSSSNWSFFNKCWTGGHRGSVALSYCCYASQTELNTMIDSVSRVMWSVETMAYAMLK